MPHLTENGESNETLVQIKSLGETLSEINRSNSLRVTISLLWIEAILMCTWLLVKYGTHPIAVLGAIVFLAAVAITWVHLNRLAKKLRQYRLLISDELMSRKWTNTDRSNVRTYVETALKFLRVCAITTVMCFMNFGALVLIAVTMIR